MVPTLFIQNSSGDANKLVFYFHGNGEDIGQAEYFLQPILDSWHAHGVAIEFPGYGIYKDSGVQQTESQFINDLQYVYDYYVPRLGLGPEQVISFGRSIGSGPATLLAKLRRVGALVLFAPLTSLRDVGSERVGMLGKFAPNMFRNVDHIKEVQCPTFIVHGLKDEIIDVKQARILYERSGAINGAKYLHTPEQMGHNQFELLSDFVHPSQAFLSGVGVIGTAAGSPPLIDIALLRQAPILPELHQPQHVVTTSTVQYMGTSQYQGPPQRRNSAPHQDRVPQFGSQEYLQAQGQYPVGAVQYAGPGQQGANNFLPLPNQATMPHFNSQHEMEQMRYQANTYQQNPVPQQQQQPIYQQYTTPLRATEYVQPGAPTSFATTRGVGSARTIPTGATNNFDPLYGKQNFLQQQPFQQQQNGQFQQPLLQQQNVQLQQQLIQPQSMQLTPRTYQQPVQQSRPVIQTHPLGASSQQKPAYSPVYAQASPSLAAGQPMTRRLSQPTQQQYVYQRPY